MGWVVSHRWLKEWVAGLPESDQVAQALTMGGFEVDEVTKVEALSDQIVVGRITDVAPHPNADRLRVCQVDVGQNEAVQIVCGCASVAADLTVAVAQVGTILPGGLAIKKTKLRGAASCGMICSKSELGLEASSDGIWHLDGDTWQVGALVNQTMGQGDVLYAVDITPNRGDCLSIQGIAREVALLLDLKCKPPEVLKPVASTGKGCPIVISAQEACHQYTSATITGLDAGAQSPLWMVERLASAGIRSLGLVVDITQYVMLELGQPMHAFDAATVSGGIQVRYAKDGEQFTGLDEVERTLKARHLVIADDTKLLGLAGLMGGQSSMVVPGRTTDVILESAAFKTGAVVKAVRDFNCHTEASNRFVRGVDPTLNARAMRRAIDLLLRYGGGKCVATEVVKGSEIEVPKITVRAKQIQRLLGMDVAEAICQKHYQKLGCSYEAVETGVWCVSPPFWRYDLAIEVDVIEEHMRLLGYDQLTPAPLSGAYEAGRLNENSTRDVLRYALAAEGLSEVISYSFVEPDFLQTWLGVREPVLLSNPMSPKMAALRSSLLPGLLETALHNVRRQHKQVRLFEVGHVVESHADGVLSETEQVGVLLHGDRSPEQWSTDKQGLDFFDLKGIMAQLFESQMQMPFDTACRLERPENPLPCFHPKQVAYVFYQDRLIGMMGVLHPRLLRASGQEGFWAFGQWMDVGAWLSASPRIFESYSSFPGIRRDICIFMPDGIECEDVIRYIREQGSQDLQKLIVFDEYCDDKVDVSRRRSLAIGMIFQNKDRSLTDEEVSRIVDHWVEGLHQALNVSMR